MGYEVEIKFRVPDDQALRAQMSREATLCAGAVDQEDTYLIHPSRDFAQTGEALRLRREGDRNFITYKGPKLTGPAKTREEFEVPVAVGREALECVTALFSRLGFQVLAQVRKSRTVFRLTGPDQGLIVALDHAEGLGTFAEVEALAATSDDLPAVQERVVAAARRLGLEQVEPRSYLRMLLESSSAADA